MEVAPTKPEKVCAAWVTSLHGPLPTFVNQYGRPTMEVVYEVFSIAGKVQVPPGPA